MARPTNEELHRRIELARTIVQKSSPENPAIFIARPQVIARDAIALGYQVNDLETILQQILNEIGVQHYAGYYPPQVAYEKDVLCLELFAYSGRIRPAIPEEAGHPFRLIPATDSGGRRPPIPEHSGHPFH